jgi:hypothetical protein
MSLARNFWRSASQPVTTRQQRRIDESTANGRKDEEERSMGRLADLEAENKQLRELNTELATQVRENRAEIGRLRNRCGEVVRLLVAINDARRWTLGELAPSEKPPITEIPEAIGRAEIFIHRIADEDAAHYSELDGDETMGEIG